MQASQDTRLNYGEHALLLSKRNFGMYSVTVWAYAAQGNTSHNPLFKEIDLGIFADYVYAKAVGEHYLSDAGLWVGA